jgi:hypothetical protein
MALLLKLDIVVIALGLPAFLALGVPVEAWLIIASAWLTQRWVRGWAVTKAKDSGDPRVLAGALAGSMIGRGWLVALTIFGCGMGFGSKSGLATAVLAIAAFTVMFTTEMIFRPFEQDSPK